MSIVRKPALASSWSSAITRRASPSLPWRRRLMLITFVPFSQMVAEHERRSLEFGCIGSIVAVFPVGWPNGHLGYYQGAETGITGNRETAAKQFHSLLHGADPNMFTWAIYLKQGPWFETTAPILHLQANSRILTFQSKTSLLGVCVLTYIGERFLRNSE